MFHFLRSIRRNRYTNKNKFFAKHSETICKILVSLRNYLVRTCGVPFKVDFVSEAKCQERVFDAAAPKRYTLWKHQTHYLSNVKNKLTRPVKTGLRRLEVSIQRKVTYLKAEDVLLLDKDVA